MLQFGYSLRLAGTAQGQKPDLGLGSRAGRIGADEGQGTIAGAERRRRIAALAEGQLLRPGGGAIEIDTPEMGTVFIGGLALAIGRRFAVNALHTVDSEGSVGRYRNAGDVADFARTSATR